MGIVAVTTVIASLFLVIGLGEPLAARLRLPFSVILAGFGVLIGGAPAFFLRTDLTDALNPAAEATLGLPIRSDLFLYVFPPTLLSQVTLGLNLRRMLDDWAPELLLAVVAVVVATLSVGYALAWAAPLPPMTCLPVGAIVSTTDHSAVVGIFRSFAAPRRLSRIIAGESLLTDAAAIALFGLFADFVTTNLPAPTLAQALARFPWLMVGGALAGAAMATVAVRSMAALGRFELAQLSLCLALPYLAYVVAEQLAHASGVIAVVAAGFTVNLTGPGRLAPALFARLRDLWDLLTHWAGGLMFVLAAVLIPRLLGDLRLTDLTLIGVVTAAAILSRAAILFGLLPLLKRLRLGPGEMFGHISALGRRRLRTQARALTHCTLL